MAVVRQTAMSIFWLFYAKWPTSARWLSGCAAFWPTCPWLRTSWSFMNPPIPLVEARRWLRFAEEDLVAAEQTLADDGSVPRHACWLAQQAAEKAIKAALISLEDARVAAAQARAVYESVVRDLLHRQDDDEHPSPGTSLPA